jgi:hypothetical protein
VGWPKKFLSGSGATTSGGARIDEKTMKLNRMPNIFNERGKKKSQGKRRRKAKENTVKTI